MPLPSEKPSRADKRKIIKPIKDNILSFANSYGLTPDEQKAFDLNKTLRLLNETFKKME